MQQIQWQDRFNIGVELVDQAHRKLFSIVQKILELYIEKHESKFACVEGIKYFKAYALKHFAEEEAYMRDIRYPGYFNHTRLHDRMRRETLPSLERELYATDFSVKSVQRFIGVCIGWLTGHIMMVDRAITGRIDTRWHVNPVREELFALEEAIACVVKEMLGITPRLVSEHYNGEDFGKAIFIRLIYRDEANARVQVYMAYEERMVLQTFGEMLGKKLSRVDKTVLYAVSQLAQIMVRRIHRNFEHLGAYRLEKENVLSYELLLKEFDRVPLYYSLLYDGSGKGYFAFSASKQ